jgi:hypothetical protein
MRSLGFRHRHNPLNLHMPAVPRAAEDELLVCCARIQMDRATEDRIRALLQGKLDWRRASDAARRHGMRPLLYWHLRSQFFELVPSQVMSELRERFDLNRARNLSLSAELIRILGQFEAAGLPALPYKGPVLAEEVYGNLAFREFDDLDILVPEDRLNQAQGILGTLGYQPTQEVPHDRADSFRRTQYELPYRHKFNRTCVELHWKIAPDFLPCGLKMNRVWKSLDWTTFAGCRVRCLTPEDSLLALCAHGSRHHWDKLEWICGVAEILRTNPRMSWKLILEHVRDTRSERVLLFGIALAEDLLGAGLPEVLRSRMIKHPQVRRLAREAQAALFTADPPQLTVVGQSLRHARLLDRWPDRVRMLARLLFRPKYHDWICFKLPAGLSFLYYPLRIFRLLWKGSSLIAGHARNTFRSVAHGRA